ncbi:hypothetical protein OHC33_004484 [Knufia fluminis]|uniref:Uncharacterized protein n=1 Tax=Knufia fluminis TaxID=191047 RepID=A0AAN8EG08_9EURO|nr:hypothetical protein OHC33_004484 [Knufia fluminis]
MPPVFLPPLLAPNPLAGVPYYRTSENASQPIAYPSRPPTVSSPPIQIAGNMLGARARAAEYNAAKAATARQQANQDEDDQKIPKPAPISLGAFTRNAFANRNKGTKTFKPLILSEEEESRSTSSVDQASDILNSPSPQPDTTDPPRASSVPVPRSLGGGAPAQDERTIQTPHRYREPHAPTMTTRTMFPEDGYGFPPHGLALPPQYLSTSFHPSSVMQQPIMQTPPAGWYMPHDYYAVQQPYHDAAMPPMTPLPDHRPATRPKLQHSESTEASHQGEPQQKSSSEHTPAEPPKTPPKVQGQRLFVFGPDDVTPTKMEMKQQAREKYFAEHGDILPTPTTGMADRSVSTPEPLEIADEDELVRYLKITGQARSMPRRKASANIEDLLIHRSSIAPSSRRVNRVDSPWDLEPTDKRGMPVLQGKTEADWPYLGQGQNYESKAVDIDATPTKKTADSNNSNRQDVTTDIKQILESMRAKQESPVKIRPPPGLEHAQAQNTKLRELQSEQITNINFPMVDMNSAEWLDVRMPTAAERDQMRRICHAVRNWSVSDKHREPDNTRYGVGRENLQKWIQVKVHDIESRHGRVEELAGEMQRKWEYGGSFRSATMSKRDAEKHAGTVKAVGGMMTALSMQLEDDTGSSQRGSRPYGQAPEYAIERSVGLGRSSSLFETDEDASIAAPPRLARDPRFRPQLTDGMKLTVEEGRIPRMFARRAM